MYSSNVHQLGLVSTFVTLVIYCYWLNYLRWYDEVIFKHVMGISLVMRQWCPSDESDLNDV